MNVTSHLCSRLHGMATGRAEHSPLSEMSSTLGASGLRDLHSEGYTWDKSHEKKENENMNG